MLIAKWCATFIQVGCVPGRGGASRAKETMPGGQEDDYDIVQTFSSFPLQPMGAAGDDACKHIHEHAHARTHTHARPRARVRAHTHSHTHIHTVTHTHSHTRIHPMPLPAPQLMEPQKVMRMMPLQHSSWRCAWCVHPVTTTSSCRGSLHPTSSSTPSPPALRSATVGLPQHHSPSRELSGWARCSTA